MAVRNASSAPARGTMARPVSFRQQQSSLRQTMQQSHVGAVPAGGRSALMARGNSNMRPSAGVPANRQMNNMGNRVGANAAGAQNANRGNMRPYSPSANGTSAGANRQASRGIGESGGYRPYTQPGNRSTAPSMGNSPRGTMQNAPAANRGGYRPFTSAERQQSSVDDGSSAPATRHVPIRAGRNRAGSVRSRRRAIGPPLHRAWDRPRSVELTSPRRQKIAAATGQSILLRGARWAAARTRTVGATVITGIARRRVTVRRSSGATAQVRTQAVATGVAHLRVHSWICGSQLYAPRRMGAVAIRGPATEVVAADIVRRLPATAVRIAHRAAVAPRPMVVEVVDITAAEVEAVADITAEAAVARSGGGGGGGHSGGRRRPLRWRSSLRIRDEQ